MREPYGRNPARKLIATIAAAPRQEIRFTQHADRALKDDDMTRARAISVLRRGRILEEAEFENGSWRYRVPTPSACVVVTFLSPRKLIVVTAWRKRA